MPGTATLTLPERAGTAQAAYELIVGTEPKTSGDPNDADDTAYKGTAQVAYERVVGNVPDGNLIW